MQRCQRRQCVQRLDDPRGDAGRRCKIPAAMNDPMSDRNERSALAFDPIDDFAEQTRAGVLKVGMASLEQKSPGGVLYDEPRVGFVLVPCGTIADGSGPMLRTARI